MSPIKVDSRSMVTDMMHEARHTRIGLERKMNPQNHNRGEITGPFRKCCQ